MFRRRGNPPITFNPIHIPPDPNPPEPLIWVAIYRTIVHKYFAGPPPPWKIIWKDSFIHIVGRTIIGAVGGSLTSLLIGALFIQSPGPRNSSRPRSPSLYERLGEPAWLGPALITLIVLFIIYWIATTRAAIEDEDSSRSDS